MSPGSATVGGMRASTGTRLRQVLLLCALALAVIGMHQLAFAHDPSPGNAHEVVAMPSAMDVSAPAHSSTPDDGGSDPVHDLMHLCLVVLCATGGFLLLAWLSRAIDGPAHTPHAVRGLLAATLWRPPRLAGRSLLSSVCLLRI